MRLNGLIQGVFVYTVNVNHTQIKECIQEWIKSRMLHDFSTNLFYLFVIVTISLFENKDPIDLHNVFTLGGSMVILNLKQDNQD